MMENMKAITKKRESKALPYGMVLIELFRFLGIDLSKEVYTNIRDENFINKTFDGKRDKGRREEKESRREF